jgi:hypothetical protein
MTIKRLLGLDAAELEAMSDEQLKLYLGPYIIAVQPPKPVESASVIHEPGSVERVVKKKESLGDLIQRMEQMQKQMLAEVSNNQESKTV